MHYQQDNYNPSDVYQPTSQNYGAGVQKQQPHYYGNNNNGFINQQPRTRAEREYMKEQEQLTFSRVTQQPLTPQRDDLKALLHSPAQNTTLFQGEHERFNKDFASEEKRNREIQNKLKQMQYEQRRLQGLEREGQIWQRNEQAYNKEEQRRVFNSEQYNVGKRNANGLAYNPLTLEYAPTEQGQQLKRYDDLSQVRQYVRAQNLDTRANCGYNILTGQQRKGVEEIVPSDLKGDYRTKVQEKDNLLNIKYYAVQQQLLANNTNSNY